METKNYNLEELLHTVEDWLNVLELTQSDSKNIMDFVNCNRVNIQNVKEYYFLNVPASDEVLGKRCYNQLLEKEDYEKRKRLKNNFTRYFSMLLQEKNKIGFNIEKGNLKAMQFFRFPHLNVRIEANLPITREEYWANLEKYSLELKKEIATIMKSKIGENMQTLVTENLYGSYQNLGEINRIALEEGVTYSNYIEGAASFLAEKEKMRLKQFLDTYGNGLTNQEFSLKAQEIANKIFIEMALFWRDLGQTYENDKPYDIVGVLTDAVTHR